MGGGAGGDGVLVLVPVLVLVIGRSGWHETSRRNKISSSWAAGTPQPCCFQWLRTKPIGATRQAVGTVQDQHCIPLLQTCPSHVESLAC